MCAIDYLTVSNVRFLEKFFFYFLNNTNVENETFFQSSKYLIVTLSVPMCTQFICRFHCFEIVFTLLPNRDVASKTSHKEGEGEMCNDLLKKKGNQKKKLGELRLAISLVS